MSSHVKILSIGILLILFLTGCYANTASNDAALGELRQFLQDYSHGEIAPSSAVAFMNELNPVLDQSAVFDQLLDWALENPDPFLILLEDLQDDFFQQSLAEYLVLQGKTFLLLEQIPEESDSLFIGLLRELEETDSRRAVAMRSLSNNSAIKSIAQLYADGQGKSWRGGAYLVIESRCHLAFATAGHNIVDAQGKQRTDLENIQVELRNTRYEVIATSLRKSSQAPENDWIFLLVQKPRCGQITNEMQAGTNDFVPIPAEGLDASLFCYHQSDFTVSEYLHREDCRIYPAEAGRLAYYQDSQPNTLGIHSCISEAGSSGCPLMVDNGEGWEFIATQIEGDSLSGAGIARLLSGQYRAELQLIRDRLVQEDLAAEGN